jgi:elongator complex protein 3
MRIQRDIPATKIIAGTKKSNLRELVKKELERRGTKCNCIRCNEPEGKIKDIGDYNIEINEYEASDGQEFFICANAKDYLIGFIRLRFSNNPFIKEIKEKTSIVRELHVYGEATEFNDKNIQHRGVGKRLLGIAEKISKKRGFERIGVISGVGVREYYKKQGYKLIGTYMIKKI